MATAALLAGMVGLLPTTVTAEEIRGEELALPGHFKLEQRFGFTDSFEPKFGSTPAGQATQKAFTGETEFSYGLTEWWDIALTSPYSYARRPTAEAVNPNVVPGYAPQTGGVTVRQIFLQPDREERDVYFGLMVRFGLSPPGSEVSDLFVHNKLVVPGTPAFVAAVTPRYFTQVSPIVSWKFGDGYRLLVNTNFNAALGSAGSSFEPNFRFVKQLTRKLDVGIEYFSILGPVGQFVPLRQEQHRLLAVTHWKMWGAEWGMGLGYGLTPASNGLAATFSYEKDF